MSNRSFTLISVAGAMALLPLAMPNSSPFKSVPAAMATTPVVIGARVVTEVRALNLAALTPADFGDNDSVR